MPPVGFEPTISEGEQPQTYSLDRTASGTGIRLALQYVKRITQIALLAMRSHFLRDILAISVFISNLLKPTGYVMHQQFNIQQLYALPTLYLCVLYLSENKQRLVPLTA